MRSTIYPTLLDASPLFADLFTRKFNFNHLLSLLSTRSNPNMTLLIVFARVTFGEWFGLVPRLSREPDSEIDTLRWFQLQLQLHSYRQVDKWQGGEGRGETKF